MPPNLVAAVTENKRGTSTLQAESDGLLARSFQYAERMTQKFRHVGLTLRPETVLRLIGVIVDVEQEMTIDSSAPERPKRRTLVFDAEVMQGCDDPRYSRKKRDTAVMVFGPG